MTSPALDSIELDPTGAVRHTVIWLHGLGADGHDFEPIVPELGLSDRLGIRFVFPHAPFLPITINGGYRMRAWYDIVDQDLGKRADLRGVAASTATVTALLEREIGRGVPPSRVILAGFSQGGVIALEVAARFRERPAGVVALSTYIADPEHFPAARAALPIFMGHGTHDDIIPHALGLRSRRLLEAKGYAVTWRDYAMPHAVCAEEIQDVAEWMGAVLGAGGPANFEREAPAKREVP